MAVRGMMGNTDVDHSSAEGGHPRTLWDFLSIQGIFKTILFVQNPLTVSTKDGVEGILSAQDDQNQKLHAAQDLDMFADATPRSVTRTSVVLEIAVIIHTRTTTRRGRRVVIAVATQGRSHC